MGGGLRGGGGGPGATLTGTSSGTSLTACLALGTMPFGGAFIAGGALNTGAGTLTGAGAFRLPFPGGSRPQAGPRHVSSHLDASMSLLASATAAPPLLFPSEAGGTAASADPRGDEGGVAIEKLLTGGTFLGG